MSDTDTDVWAETSITPEGVTTTLYRLDDDGVPVVVDETGVPWADLIPTQDGWSKFQGVDIDPETLVAERFTDLDLSSNEHDGSRRHIGTLGLTELASVSDIEAMIDYGLESAIGIDCVCNEDGTYDVLMEDDA